MSCAPDGTRLELPTKELDTVMDDFEVHYLPLKLWLYVLCLFLPSTVVMLSV